MLTPGIRGGIRQTKSLAVFRSMCQLRLPVLQIPTTLGLELATNPFLRPASPGDQGGGSSQARRVGGGSLCCGPPQEGLILEPFSQRVEIVHATFKKVYIQAKGNRRA